jgi:signal peptidase II
MTTAPGRRPHWLAFAALALAVVGVDQLTKAWITAALADRPVIEVVGDLVRLIYSKNSGALFGILQDQAVVFAAVSVAVAVLIVVAHGRAGRSPYLTVTLGLLLGGWAGNFIDRVRLGYVIDFVDAGIGDLRFWTFNVADSCITISILLLLLLAYRPTLGAWRSGTDAAT